MRNLLCILLLVVIGTSFNFLYEHTIGFPLNDIAYFFIMEINLALSSIFFFNITRNTIHKILYFAVPIPLLIVSRLIFFGSFIMKFKEGKYSASGYFHNQSIFWYAPIAVILVITFFATKSYKSFKLNSKNKIAFLICFGMFLVLYLIRPFVYQIIIDQENMGRNVVYFPFSIYVIYWYAIAYTLFLLPTYYFVKNFWNPRIPGPA